MAWCASWCCLCWLLGLTGCRPPATEDNTAANPLPDRFFSLMNQGKNHLNQGDAPKALEAYSEAAKFAPKDPNLAINKAIAHLLNDSPTEAIQESDQALALEPHSAAAHFVKGSALLRLSNAEDAVKTLELSRAIDSGVTATYFQLGLARMGLQQWEAAISAFREGIRLEPNRLHTTAHYLLGQSLLRAGRTEEAEQELQQHQSHLEGQEPSLGAAVFERCKHTRARVPFRMKQPDQEGIRMTFQDATQEVLGDFSRQLSGPSALIQANNNHPPHLIAFDPKAGIRTLRNENGKLSPNGQPIPITPTTQPSKILIGDFQNDRLEDILVLGTNGSHLFTGTENGTFLDHSATSGLTNLKAHDGLLLDLDFTGKLDLVAVSEDTRQIAVYRQSDPLQFAQISEAAGIPSELNGVSAVTMEDWNHDQVMDLIIGQSDGPPQLLEKQRGGSLIVATPPDWPTGSVIYAADLDNDLRPDLVVHRPGALSVCFNNGNRTEIDIPQDQQFQRIRPVDFDNDGWLDLFALGDRTQVWRNLGTAGFKNQTERLGLDSLPPVSEVHFADFDGDCDSDLVMALTGGGLRYWRNEGGNTNQQIKVQMVGNRSNAAGIGCKIEIESGGLRLIRTVHQLPVEVGVGQNQTLDSFLVHWFNWAQGSAQVPVQCQEPLLALELTIQEGSCPYLYAWDGKQFRFVTDILGSAPLGLPVAPGRYIEADPEEWVWIGTEQTFSPKDGAYQIRITEELREVLYLDEAKLAIVDHEPGTEVHPLDKLVPSKPFPVGDLLTVHREYPLRHAEDLSGKAVTAALQSVDGQRASPPQLRSPQLRGLAEPHGWVLDFGPLAVDQPLVLVLNGWLRFGGGMANISASLEPSLPFPFPTLEAEVAPNTWQPVDVTVGAPSGKTKTILVDLEDKLPPETRRLRLQAAFEIHWDRIALMEKHPSAGTKIHFAQPNRAQLQFRGFSTLKDLPSDWPLTPDYNRVTPYYYWTVNPRGWCTRYGDVSELIAARDEGLLIMNAGDELSLSFPVESLPPKAPGAIREFFLYVDGWDKDSDFHVAAGTQVKPLPYHGMDDQQYARLQRPAFASDALHQKYNTRWAEGNGFQPPTPLSARLASQGRIPPVKVHDN